MSRLLSFSLLVMLLNFSAWAKVSKEAQNTYDDIKNTLGSVPAFFKDFPEQGIAGAWADMKGVQLNPNTALSGKYKELIGLAVASQIPCKYCVYFHTKASKLNNASSEEQKEAVAMAASVRRWSTILHGSQTNMDEFKTEVDKVFEMAHKNKSKQAMEEMPMKKMEMSSAKDAYKDMEATLGFVPTFLKNYPRDGVVGVWKEMKGVEMNPNSALPAKYKELVGVAVAAQVPCPYCVYYHTQAAMMNGASAEEVNEAIAIAGITREWSTILNGHDREEKDFKADVDKVMKHLQGKNKKVTAR